MTMIFVNLPIKNLAASKAFFSALGYSFNEKFQDETTTCMIIDQNIYVMLLEEARFKEFLTGEVADTSKGTEVLTCLSCESRAEVDSIYAKAIAAGARPWKPMADHGFMYNCSFQDINGHVWEYMWMDPAAQQ